MSASHHGASLPRWIPAVLWSAAIYNLAWGTFVVLFPALPFRWAGMEPPNYPSLVQCLGMVIGVYGIGYAIAARDPVTHWPIVLVGLLGKIFGPIGFVWAVLHGEFPWTAGWTILTNDLAWWLPFAAILLHGAREREFALSEAAGAFIDELGRAQTDSGQTLRSLSDERPTLVLFVRHTGCTFCREALDDLHRHREQWQSRGLQAAVVHMTDWESGRALMNRYGLNDVPQISDPDRRLYRAFALRLGTLNELFGPAVVWRALLGGALFRYGAGAMRGNVLQLSGAFVVYRGAILRAYRNRSTADKPDIAALSCGVEPASV